MLYQCIRSLSSPIKVKKYRRRLLISVLVITVLQSMILFMPFVAVAQQAPSTDEIALFEVLRSRFPRYSPLLQNAPALPSVSQDFLDSFINPTTGRCYGQPLIISWECPHGHRFAACRINITTKLVRWDPNVQPPGKNWDGCYTWSVRNRSEPPGGVKYWEFSNTIMFDFAEMSGEEGDITKEGDDWTGEIANVALYYHELLHGQLLIDAMKNNQTWRNNFCDCTFDDTPSDPNHITIDPSHQEFAKRAYKQEAQNRGYQWVDRQISVPGTPGTDVDDEGNFFIEFTKEAEKVQMNLILSKKIVIETDPNTGELTNPSISPIVGEPGNWCIVGKLKKTDESGQLTVAIDPNATLLFFIINIISSTPVDGIAVPIDIPVDKFGLLAPYVALVATIILAVSISVAYIKYRKKQ